MNDKNEIADVFKEYLYDDKMPEELKAFLAVDDTKQIIDLWYELTFLRMIVATILNENDKLKKILTDEVYDKYRESSQEIVKNKFPLFNIEFTKTSEFL